MTELVTPEQLARDVLAMAQDGGMPDSYWATDPRIFRACTVLGIGTDVALDVARDHGWTT